MLCQFTVKNFKSIRDEVTFDMQAAVISEHEDRIIKEDNSTSTYENFEYSKLIMDEGQAVFVTNEFHVLRSELMAKINGIDATHIGASTPIPLLPVSCVREFIAQIAAVRYYF